ncbi:TonB-dependent siderophore receptor [Noviherbaspirillum saxi]|uniref:TonB-dependent siderophore receptor n=1 Tax=Noviherbaspirillum saxi TaxID=2320863 RepID=A0A3A3FV28_9BURK|nr:TonB-dependent siderophore receptor [Noviherbaspirillum saxi]RJF99194.1 TonB-dependent siderophore receptor [Noviherbaspirillum saxi]
MQFRLTLMASAVMFAFATPQAAAQDPSQEKTDKELGTITVTAERAGSFKSNAVQVGTFRDLAPLDVPQTSNVITREVLDAQAATTLYGALRNTAGVTRSQLSGSTYDNIAIRGILVENRGNYRLNGSLPIINLIDVPLENKERVEVLKGASSLYYGFVPPSGIVNFVTKRAGKDPVTNFALSANEHGAASIHADIGRRFGEQQQMGARINLVGGREDIGIDNYSGDRMLASAAFDLRATRELSFKLDLEHYRKNVSEQAAIALPAAVNGRITLPPVPDATRNLAGEWQKYDANATNILFRTDYLLNDRWAVLFEAGKARTGRDRNFSQFQNYNLATGQGTLRIFFNRDQEWENENYRTEVTGHVPGTWLTHDLTFGYTGNNRDQVSRASGTVDVAQNLYNPIAIAPQSPTAPSVASPSAIKDRGWYLSDRVSIGDKWQAMVGVRGSRYESVTPTARYEADDVSPSVSLMYKPLSNVSVYASYIEGVEESGQAPANRANGGELLPPAVSEQKEIGVKAEVAQGVLLQAAYFDIKRPSTTVDAANRFVLNGLAQYRGIELAASGEITKQLSVIGSALFLDAEQLNAANATTFGRTPENTPKRTASLFAEYRLASVPGLALSGGVFYVGDRPVNNENLATLGGYSTVSLGARYLTKVAGKRTTLQAVMDNVTDKSYWSTAGNGFVGVGAPRTLKVTAKMEF